MLTDHDLTVIDGNKDQLIGKIQEKYGLAKRMPESKWMSLLGPTFPQDQGAVKRD